MLILIAICLPVCIIMAAFAVNVAWMQLTRTELRTATDAAARAGAKTLSLTQSSQSAKQAAKTAAARNLVAGTPLKLVDRDITVGRGTQPSDTSRFQFTAGGTKPNAVRVSGRRTSDSASGPVNLLFAGVLGTKQFEPRETATSTQMDRDICLVVDRSGSMMWVLTGGSVYPPFTSPCGPPHPLLSRWGALSTSVNSFLDELVKTPQEENVALVSYSSDTNECGKAYKISQIDSDLVSDYAAIRSSMGALSGKPVKGATSISAGIDDGIRVLTGGKIRKLAEKTMIVMTDGIHNHGKEPIISARNAAKKEIVIHTITFSDDADIARMKAVASATGGNHYHAPTAADLVKIFKEIAKTLPVLLTE